MKQLSHAAIDPSGDTGKAGDRLIVLVPVYNDWTALGRLLMRLDTCLGGTAGPVRVVVVDDGSSESDETFVSALRLDVVSNVTIVSLRRNMGHQRAIAMGLAYVEECLPCQCVVVMDGDGEDDPADVPRLVDRMHELGDSAIVFAERTRRMEGAAFRVCYLLYRVLHRLLTGIPVKVGNFSAIPARLVRRLVVVSELWNHYAAAVFHSRIPRATIATVRRPRLHGRSKMNFVSLVGHGLSALSVHSELLGVRLLVAGAVCAGGLLAGLAGLAWYGLSAGAAPAGWVMAGGVLGVLLLGQVVGFLAVFALTILRGRSTSTFLPARDYAYFVEGVRTLAQSRA